MRTCRITALLLFLSLLVSLLTACGGNAAPLSSEEEKLIGKWAYSHDPKKAVLTVRQNGKAVYEGKNYLFSCDGAFITLTAADGSEQKLRYRADEDGILLYQPCTYTREEHMDGITGIWTNQEQNWSYQFTTQGTFLEDGVFSGQYFVDEEASTFKLVYSTDPRFPAYFEDTICYFLLDEDSLLVEYPWQMVKAQ